MTVDQVRDALHVEGSPSQVVLSDGTRASAEEFTAAEGVVHVEYDGLASRQETRAALIWQPLPVTYDTVAALVKRFGEPTSGRDALVQGLQKGPATWVVPKCDAVITYYRRPEFWLSDVTTLLRVERLSRLPGESPAIAAVQEWRASGATPATREAPSVVATASPATAPALMTTPAVTTTPAVGTAPAAVTAPPAVTATPATNGEHPPRRTAYVRPVYPERAKQAGVKGIVKLRVFVQKNGKVSLARVSRVEPPGYGFETAAVEAADKWRFIPASSNGRPTEGVIDVEVRIP